MGGVAAVMGTEDLMDDDEFDAYCRPDGDDVPTWFYALILIAAGVITLAALAPVASQAVPRSYPGLTPEVAVSSR